MTNYLAGVRAQPENLRRSAAIVRAALAGPIGARVAALAGAGGPGTAAASGPGLIVAFGMGASTHAAAGFAAVLRVAGVPAIAASAADLQDGIPAGLAATYLAISQSGRSRETVAAMAAVPAGVARLALTNDPDGPLGAAADVAVPLGCAEDTAVSTLSYTATLQALGLLADRLRAGRPGDTGRPGGTAPTDIDRPPTTDGNRAVPAGADLPAPVERRPAAFSGEDRPPHATKPREAEPAHLDAGRLADLAAEVLDGDAGPIAAALDGASSVDVVGSGMRVASAGAAALLLREAAHLPAAGFATHEYLHGPLETAGPGRAVLLFGAGREVSLAADLAGYGARVVLVTDATADLPEHPRVDVVRRPAVAGLGGCVLDIMPVQLAAHALAERAGRPIALRHMPADTKLPAG